MHGLETLIQLNRGERPPLNPLRLHPKIEALRRRVCRMAVDIEYRAWLLHCLYRYADQIVSRPEPAPGEGWSNFEALQQVALSDRMERSLQRLIRQHGGGQ